MSNSPSRFRKNIKVNNSPYFTKWSGVKNISLKEIFDLYTLLCKYSYIVSNGETKISFLVNDDKKSSSFSSDNKNIYINVKKLLEGEIDAVIGEIIFKLIANDGLSSESITSLFIDKLEKSSIDVVKNQSIIHTITNSNSSGTIYNFKKLLNKKYLIDSSELIETTFAGIPYKSGDISIINSFADMEEDCSEISKSLFDSKDEVDKLSDSLGKLESLYGCLLFFKRYNTMPHALLKYCETYITHNLDSSFLSTTFISLAQYYLFNDTIENKELVKFLQQTGLHDVTKHSVNEITIKTFSYFEDVLEVQVQNILNKIKGNELIDESNPEILMNELNNLDFVSHGNLETKGCKSFYKIILGELKHGN